MIMKLVFLEAGIVHYRCKGVVVQKCKFYICNAVTLKKVGALSKFQNVSESTQNV